MGQVIPVIIIRHPKEKISKCSLEHLRGVPGLTFLNANKNFRFDATGHILLTINAPPLTAADAGYPLILLDSTWRLLPQLDSCLTGRPLRRSLPKGFRTAYPRKSKIFKDPPESLASVEALYLAKQILGENDPLLLDGYRWKEPFLESLKTR